MREETYFGNLTKILARCSEIIAYCAAVGIGLGLGYNFFFYVIS